MQREFLSFSSLINDGKSKHEELGRTAYFSQICVFRPLFSDHEPHTTEKSNLVENDQLIFDDGNIAECLKSYFVRMLL